MAGACGIGATGACRRGVLNVTRSLTITARYDVRDGIAVVTLDHPPVNGLNYDTRVAIASGIDRALADASVSAIVLTGGEKLFSGGADIREFGKPEARAEPTLHTLIRIV